MRMQRKKDDGKILKPTMKLRSLRDADKAAYPPPVMPASSSAMRRLRGEISSFTSARV